MRHINQVLERNPSPNNPGKSRKRYSPTSRQERLVSALWQRMRQLFGSKWASQAGPAKLENGRYSNEFLLWCRKLEGLTDAEYQRGFARLEYLVREAGRKGEDLWPPSYAGFLGYCEPPIGQRSYKLFPSNIDPKAPPLALPDKAAQERARKAGTVELEKLRGFFS